MTRWYRRLWLLVLATACAVIAVLAIDGQDPHCQPPIETDNQSATIYREDPCP